MRVLFYNWDPIDGPAGGGVTGYLKELFRSALTSYPKLEIWFLNSGRSYDEKDESYIRKRKNIFGKRIHAYEVVNSPVLAPGRQSPVNVSVYLEDRVLENIIGDFIEENGVFDVVHFHNTEGISLGVLKLKEKFPKTKWLLTLHNYYPFCPQVNLWSHGERNCAGDDPSDCVGCFVTENMDLARFRFAHLDIPELKNIFYNYSATHPDKAEAKHYEQYRKETLFVMNSCFDEVLCVSKRTKEVAERAGIRKNILRLSYAGSAVAGRQRGYKGNGNTEALHIIYLGYAFKEKGFDFFLRAVDSIPKKMAEKLFVTVVARANEETCRRAEEILNIPGRYEGSIYLNGYEDEDELEKILSAQDLGIIPVLWEDNLPRVAMEQFAAGIPLLTSDLGGAKELGGDNPDFVFRAGDIEDFIEKLRNIMEHRELLGKYFEQAIKLKTMDEHLKELMEIYEGETIMPIEIS
ncbi:MAG: glycosyltransferase [Lachnospiraceae bacterium]|nr:glycosyltransferase [Lachnospiraceae bacterium]MBR1743206.1 glycosyltransferase [Lachnospiraceae bacterium]